MNYSIKKAKGDILIFFDDNIIIQPNYFKNLIKTYKKNNNIGAVMCINKKTKNSIFHKLLFKLKKNKK